MNARLKVFLSAIRAMIFPIGVLFVLFLVQAIVMLAMDAQEAMRLGSAHSKGMMTGFAVTVSFILALPACMSLINLRYRLVFSRTDRMPSEALIVFGLPGIRSSISWIISLIAVQACASLAFHLLGLEESGFMLYAYTTRRFPVLFLMATVLAGPLIEECLFRGIMIDRLMKHCSPLCAALGTSMLWGMIHFQYTGAERFYIVALGMLLSYSRIRSGSLTLPLALHSLNNAMAIGLLHLQ